MSITKNLDRNSADVGEDAHTKETYLSADLLHYKHTSETYEISAKALQSNFRHQRARLSPFDTRQQVRINSCTNAPQIRHGRRYRRTLYTPANALLGGIYVCASADKKIRIAPPRSIRSSVTGCEYLKLCYVASQQSGNYQVFCTGVGAAE
jgi:hypothetical protein